MLSSSTTKLEPTFIFNTQHQLFLNFIQHTDQAKNAVQYMRKIISAQKPISGSAFQFLDIGCGYGYKTLSIANLIRENHFVSTTAIDPSAELLSIFKEQSENEVHDHAINFVCTTWEEYQPTTHFDLITSIHTFYYIEDWELAINKMLKYLNTQGLISIAIRSNDEVCQFKDHFFKKLYGSAKKERNFNELTDLAKNMGVKYKTDIIQSKLNIIDCLLENDKGKQLIEFLLRLPYADIPDDIKKEIKHYLEVNQDNGYLNHQDGFIWISP
jgi:SAM-dependent methyltransferase